ncbi:hypothetical protein IAT38_007060 [Cryptococcus sp. DSM 104549]
MTLFRLTPLTARTLTRTVHPVRALSTTAPRLNKGPPTTQGHSTNKPSHTDPQSTSVSSGQAAKSSAGGSGEAEPFDAARQGGQGGEAKQSAEKNASGEADGQAGALKDQVGGQEGGSKGVEFGKEEEAAGESVGDSLKKTLGSFSGLRKLRDENKNFHTSARAYRPQEPSADVPGSRDPKEAPLPGDQNEHLKHSSASSQDKGKGNAAETPHLPSKEGKGEKGKRGMHTSARLGASPPANKYAKALPSEGNRAGLDAPPEALPPNLESVFGHSKDAIQPPDANQTPASKVPHSSTAVDPPHPVLRQQALDGTLAERNTQPTAEMGRQGNDEAWKHRK